MTPVAQVLYWPPRVHVRVEDEPDEFDAEFTPFSEVRAGGVGRLGTRLRVGVTGSDDSTIVVATARTAVAFPVLEVPKNARQLRVNATFTALSDLALDAVGHEFTDEAGDSTLRTWVLVRPFLAWVPTSQFESANWGSLINETTFDALYDYQHRARQYPFLVFESLEAEYTKPNPRVHVGQEFGFSEELLFTKSAARPFHVLVGLYTDLKVNSNDFSWSLNGSALWQVSKIEWQLE